MTTSSSFRPDVFRLVPPTLLGSQCSLCAGRTFPEREVCPHCLAFETSSPIELSTTGRIYSYTIVRQAPPGLTTPFVLAYIDLLEDGVRIMARIEGVDIEHVAIGDAVRLTSRPDEADPSTFTYAFEPMNQASVAS